MLIDFHTHFFPDAIAENSVKQIEKKAHVKARFEGTYDSLVNTMQSEEIDYAVNLPVATKAEQVKSINRKMLKLQKSQRQVILFGAMHPRFHEVGSIEEEFAFLKHNGFKGIKMHPEYQFFYPDDPDVEMIYEACLKNDMILVLHSGDDFAFQETHATPKRIHQVKLFSRDIKLVLAHMGAYRRWDEVERYLMGLHDVYFDTAFCYEMPAWQMKEIILGHGPYKILFGSDFPWEDPMRLINKIRSLGLGQFAEDMIFYKNAVQLLGIKL